MLTTTPDYQLVHFLVCNYAWKPEQAMVLYHLYFSHFLGSKRALFLLECATHVLWFFRQAKCWPWPCALIKLISITSLLKGIYIIFKWELPEGRGSVGCYLCVQISDGLYRRWSQTAQWQSKKQQAQKKKKRKSIHSCNKNIFCCFLNCWDGWKLDTDSSEISYQVESPVMEICKSCSQPRALGCRWSPFE